MAHEVVWNLDIYNEFVRIACLTDDEKDVIRTRVINKWSVVKQAEELGMSVSKVNQITKKLKEPYDYNYRMGYRHGDKTMRNEPSRHGEAYDRYQMARRYYTENPTGEMKMQMNNSWDEAVDDAIQAIKKMYMDAEAPQRTKVMEKMQKAINEMPS